MTTFRGRTPTKLAFGTSGLRGLVVDITDLEAYINTVGFLEFAMASGDAKRGDVVYLGGDLRPSTHSEQRSIMAAVQRGIVDCGLNVVNCGRVPTPALTFYALQHSAVSVMVTGSHIPFDRNGIKFNRARGEVLKSDEAPILAAVDVVRRREYERAPADSLFDDEGAFRVGARPTLAPPSDACAELYRRRYVQFVGARALAGLVVVFYQHSAVGRDLLPSVLRDLGAVVYAPRAARSDTFVPIDTEAMSAARIGELQRIADAARAELGHIDAIVSTDGDSDRPLVVGVEPRTGAVRFVGGDLLGVVVADWLGATSVAVPISSNDAVERHLAKRNVSPKKTKIGSPYVVQAMMDAAAADPASSVVGWEANGGFLTGSPIVRSVNGVEQTLAPLPTRDAMLPLVAVLATAASQGKSIVQIFDELPSRFSKADLIDNFPSTSSAALIKMFAPPIAGTIELEFEPASQTILGSIMSMMSSPNTQDQLRTLIETNFVASDGFDGLTRVNWIDGVRLYFKNGDVVHVRASGNAPQLRCYAVANTQERADKIVALAIAEPNGLLRKLESIATKQ